ELHLFQVVWIDYTVPAEETHPACIAPKQQYESFVVELFFDFLVHFAAHILDFVQRAVEHRNIFQSGDRLIDFTQSCRGEQGGLDSPGRQAHLAYDRCLATLSSIRRNIESDFTVRARFPLVTHQLKDLMRRAACRHQGGQIDSRYICTVQEHCWCEVEKESDQKLGNPF